MRVCWRHMGKYIPGNPNIIVQDHAWRGILQRRRTTLRRRQTRWLDPRHPGSGIYLDQLLGRKEASFDVAKLAWLGSIDQRDLVLYMKADAPWKSIEDVMNSKEQPKCGATGTSDLTSIVANILDETLGVESSRRSRLSGRRRDRSRAREGRDSLPRHRHHDSLAREPYFTWHKTGFDRHIVPTGAKKDPRPPGRRADAGRVSVDKKKTSSFSRSVAKVMLVFGDFGQPMMSTPGTPADRVKILREAYLKTFNDPEVVQKQKEHASIFKPLPARSGDANPERL